MPGTERKDLYEALNQREQQLAGAQRVAHLGSWEWDVAANRVSWWDGLYRIFALEPHEFEATYEGFLGHVHPDDVAMVSGWVGAAVEGGGRLDGEHRVVRPGEAICDEAGAPRLMRGTALDITASKRAEEALQKTTARYLLLQKMASAANEASTVDEVLQTAVDHICARTGWPVGRAYLPAANDGDPLVFSGIWHSDEPERFAALARRPQPHRAGRTGSGAVAAERFRRAVADLELPHTGNPGGGTITISIGVAVCRPGDDTTAENVLNRADIALYRAKANGRNGVALADETAVDGELAV